MAVADREALKKALGVECGNCHVCAEIAWEYEDYGSPWAYCANDEQSRDGLKSFPFKKEQKCWEPAIHHTKLYEQYDFTEHEEYLVALKKFSGILEEHGYKKDE